MHEHRVDVLRAVVVEYLRDFETQKQGLRSSSDAASLVIATTTTTTTTTAITMLVTLMVYLG